MLGILELSRVTESRVQCVHSSRVGFGKLQPVAPVRPILCFCKVLWGTASLSICCLWLPLHRTGRTEQLLQRSHNPHSLEFLLPGVLEKTFANT